MSLMRKGSSFSSASPVCASSLRSMKKYTMVMISAMHISTTPKATERLTLTTPPRRAKKGEKIITVATPRRANAISEPMASAISRPLNHFTIPRLTVMPAISQPQPNTMKPQAANLAEAGMPS